MCYHLIVYFIVSRKYSKELIIKFKNLSYLFNNLNGKKQPLSHRKKSIKISYSWKIKLTLKNWHKVIHNIWHSIH